MKSSIKGLLLAMAIIIMPTGLTYGQANDSYKKLLGADTIISSHKVDVNKDGKSEMLVYYSKGNDAYLDLIVNNTSVLHGDMGMVGESNKLKVTDIGKAGLIIENNVHLGGSGGPGIGVFHLKPDFSLTAVKAEAEPLLTTDGSKNIIVTTDNLTTRYQVVLPAKIKGQMPSQLDGKDYYYKTYGNQYKYAKGVAEITFVYSVTLSVISNSTMPFDVYQTYVLEKDQWVAKTLSVKEAGKSGVKITTLKPSSAKPAKVTVESLLADGKLPDGLIVGKSTVTDLKKIYGEPISAGTIDGVSNILYRQASFVASSSDIIQYVTYRSGASILGLTTDKSTSKDVKALIIDKYKALIVESDDASITLLTNKEQTRYIEIFYWGEKVFSITIGVK